MQLLTLSQSNLILSGELSFLAPSAVAVRGLVTASGFIVSGSYASGTSFTGKFTQVGDGEFKVTFITEERKDGVLKTTEVFEGTATTQ